MQGWHTFGYAILAKLVIMTYVGRAPLYQCKGALLLEGGSFETVD